MRLLPDRRRARGTVDVHSMMYLRTSSPSVDSFVWVKTATSRSTRPMVFLTDHADRDVAVLDLMMEKPAKPHTLSFNAVDEGPTSLIRRRWSLIHVAPPFPAQIAQLRASRRGSTAFGKVPNTADVSAGQRSNFHLNLLVEDVLCDVLVRSPFGLKFVVVRGVAQGILGLAKAYSALPRPSRALLSRLSTRPSGHPSHQSNSYPTDSRNRCWNFPESTSPMR